MRAAGLAGVSLAGLLGGAVRPEVALTEYFSYRLAGPSHPGESSPLEVARYCAQMIEQHGAGAFEGKVCTVLARRGDRDGARGARGDRRGRRLTLDANGGWTVPTAREAIRRLDPFEIFYYEDPVETHDELAQLRAHTGASFSTHVIDLGKTIELGVPDAIVTNLNELGGIRRTVEFIAACARFDVGFRFHSGETGIATAAYLGVSGAVEHVREPSQTLVRWYADDVIEGGPFSPEDGVLAVPTGPGLGVTLDREALRRCHERYLREGPFPSGGASRGYGASFRRADLRSSESRRVHRDVAGGRPRLGRPARTAALARRGVEAEARDHHVGVRGHAVDRDPLARARVAPAGEVVRRHRRVDQSRAVQREAHRAGAVVAGVLPGVVSAAVQVRLVRDLVSRRDDRDDGGGCAGRRDRETVRADRAVRGRCARDLAGRLRRRRGPPVVRVGVVSVGTTGTAGVCETAPASPPLRTTRLSVRASFGDMTPSIRSPAARSNERMLARVCGPNSPSVAAA